jgi:hypothetical protein
MWTDAAMNRGLGVWQRRLLAALEERPTVSMVDVLPPPHARWQYVAPGRVVAAREGQDRHLSLATQGTDVGLLTAVRLTVDRVTARHCVNT